MEDDATLERLVGKRGKDVGVIARSATLTSSELASAVLAGVEPDTVDMALASMAVAGDSLHIAFSRDATLLRRRRLLEAVAQLGEITMTLDTNFKAFFDQPNPSELPQVYFVLGLSPSSRDLLRRWAAPCADALPEVVSGFLQAESDGATCWLGLGSLVVTVVESRHVSDIVASAIRFSVGLRTWPRTVHLVNASGTRAVSLGSGYGMRFSGTSNPADAAAALDLLGPGIFGYVFPQACLPDHPSCSWTLDDLHQVLDANGALHGWPPHYLLEPSRDGRSTQRDWLTVLDLYPWQFVSPEFRQRVDNDPAELHGGLARLDIDLTDQATIARLHDHLGHAIALGHDALAEEVRSRPAWWLANQHE